MHTTIRRPAIAALLAFTASGAASAAETTELSVRGVIKPAACTVALSGGGVVDFGTIAASSLSNVRHTTLPDATIATTVTCEAPTRIALKVIDGRPGTAARTEYGFDGHGKLADYYGFGEVSGKKLGAYALRLRSDLSIDGVAANPLTSGNNGQSWSNSASNRYVRGDGSVIAAAQTGATIAPTAGTVFNMAFDIHAAVESTPNLPPLTSEVPLDGRATITVVYL